MEVLAEVARVAQKGATERKGASEVRVDVVKASFGPMVNVRKFITSPPSGSSTYYVGKGRKRTLKHRSQYTGPDRQGMAFDSFDDALATAEAIVQAVLAAEGFAAEMEADYEEYGSGVMAS